MKALLDVEGSPLIGYMLDTRKLLEERGYEYYGYDEPPLTPEYAEVTFGELLGLSKAEGRLGELLDKRLYKHQLEAYRALAEGFNLALRAGTGSGKTEAWIIYAVKERRRVLALYPTLALANDQLARLRDYSGSLGFRVMAIDSVERGRLSREGVSSSKIRTMLASSDVVVTNPAFLLMDLKRVAAQPSRSLFISALRSLDLLVLDELDFYGPRELSLLLAMIEIVSELSDGRLQVAVLTATLAEPGELCGALKRFTGRECRVVGGKPFRVENRVTVVLGKNLKGLYEEARSYAKLLRENGAGEDVLRALEDYGEFKRGVYKVVEALRALGVEMPSPHVDPLEVISGYVDDEYVTLVFTRSISRAEELYRKLRYSLPEDKRGLVASHHHLVSKERRSEIEEAARRGEVKVIFTPRTLAQGIDIGTVARIVHVGLPDTVREFRQREGRKGRREDIEFTETVIVPGSRWDRELLSRGLETFKAWAEAPLELAVVNPENKYGFLFRSLYKFKSGAGLEAGEREFLEKLGLLRGNSLTRRGERAWYYINFYEFAPPFGIKRVMVRSNGEERYLEDISFSDLVEKFQVGCFDYSSDGVVVELELGGRSGRMVRRVKLAEIREPLLYKYEPLAYALEEYRRVKHRWGEKPSLFSDYVRGRIHSDSICNVRPPTTGFGMYVKIPYKVVWIVEGEGGRLVDTSAGTLVLRERRVIEVPSMVAGRYTDYGYGEVFELDPGEKLERIRLGLATLMVFLREEFRLPLGVISYSLSSVGGRKTMILWEEESSGLVEKLDWERIYRALEEWKPSPIAEIYLEEQDEEAHLEWLALGGRWDLAVDMARRVVSYVLLSKRVRVTFSGRELYVPKPGPQLGLLALDTLLLPLTEDGEVALGLIAMFDGERVTVSKFLREYTRTSGEKERLEGELREKVDAGYSVLVYGLERVREELHSMGLTYYAALLSGLIEMGKIVDVEKEYRRVLGEEYVPLRELAPGLGVEYKHGLEEVASELARSQARIRGLPYSKWLYFTKFLTEKAAKFLEANVKAIYMAWLALRELEAANK